MGVERCKALVKRGVDAVNRRGIVQLWNDINWLAVAPLAGADIQPRVPSAMPINPADRGLLILTSLAGGPKHGYALMKDIESFAGVRLGPGTLYGALARLEEDGLVAPLPAQDRRRPYRITPAGSLALQRELSESAKIAKIGLQRLTTAGL